MARVKIKTHNSKDPRRTTKLLEILSCNDVYVTKLIPVNDGFIILTSSNDELDKIFNNTTDKKLEENDFLPQIPTELTSNRSVLIFRVDNHIHGNTERNIKEEIEHHNEWVGDIKVVKFGKDNTIKITFSDTTKAKKAQETGLKLFSMRIPSYNIKQDEYIGIMTCMRCYTMEDHSTAQCNKDREAKICSECSSRNHTWRECDAGSNKKCITCEGPHSTLAMSCPKRKEIVNQKRKERKSNETSSYSAKAKKNTPNPSQTMHHQATTTPTNPTNINIYQAMLHSHFVNVAKPGSYSKTFNDLMRAHNLPTLEIQEDPPSLEIITRLSQVTGINPPTGTETERMETTEHTEEEAVTNEAHAQQDAQQPETSQITQEDLEVQEPRKTANGYETLKYDSLKAQEKDEFEYEVKGEDIGLMIYTKNSTGWPKKEGFSREQLIKGIKNKKYKYTYTKKNLTDEEILQMIENRLIDLKGPCFTKIEDSSFSKIRNGIIEELTPPPSKEQRKGK